MGGDHGTDGGCQGYGAQLLERLADDLTKRLGRGFSIRNLRSFRAFYLSWPIRQTLSAESEKVQLLSTQFDLTEIAHSFPLSWSHYVKLLAVRDAKAREFYVSKPYHIANVYAILDS